MNRQSVTNLLTLTVLAGGALLLAGAAGAGGDDKEFKALFNGTDLDGWKTELPNSADPAKVFRVEDGKIVVSGSPAGYFYTDKSYKNYVLKFDWMYDKGGNSGLLVHIQPPQRVWPRSVEVQGQMNDHGRIFAIGGAKGQFSTDKDAQKKAIKGAGVWHTTTVVSRDGALTSSIDGYEVGKGKGDLTEGPFGFQSEGAKLYFKNIRIKETD